MYRCKVNQTKKKGKQKMKTYKVIVSGVVIGSYNTREEAEKRLNEARHSFLAMVHPRDCFYIRVE